MEPENDFGEWPAKLMLDLYSEVEKLITAFRAKAIAQGFSSARASDVASVVFSLFADQYPVGARRIKHPHVWRAGADDAVCSKCGITSREATAKRLLEGCRTMNKAGGSASRLATHARLFRSASDKLSDDLVSDYPSNTLH